MLQHLLIRNLAVIDTVALELAPGFNVLTGETGAGKSILIDAVGLILGARADNTLIRPGSDAAEVTAEFALEVSTSTAREWLDRQQLSSTEEPDRCVVRRVVRSEGRSRCFVNDHPVSLSALQELGSQLIEIFGQGESRTLVHADIQRNLLDTYGVDYSLLQATAAAAEACHQIQKTITALAANGGRDIEQLALLRYQLDEMDKLGLDSEGLEALNTEHRKLTNAAQLLQEGSKARAALYGDDQSIYDQITTVGTVIEQLAALDSSLHPAAELTSTAQVNLREAADLLSQELDKIDLDPKRLEIVEDRLAAIHDLARKHRVRAAELPECRLALKTELDTVENLSTTLASLERDMNEARGRYDECTATLSGQRSDAAKQLADVVNHGLRQLGMSNAVFEVRVEHTATDKPNISGNDQIEFAFTANPGQPPKSLGKIASGGELSRIGLALQVALRQAAAVPTMIFDEVDAGIGGAVAEIVGQQLRLLGETSQVVCVTHLAQVAAKGQRHIHVTKEVLDQNTYTRIRILDRTGRVAELARMSGGRTVTATTEAHARELLADDPAQDGGADQ